MRSFISEDGVTTLVNTTDTVPRYVPALDGLRAVAAIGVIATHVSFQTGTGWGIAERLDYMVAVFFALSAFVLWRRRAAHTLRDYYFARFRRVMPAYWACVVAVLILLPGARFSWAQVVANLTATQIYVADGLAQGLTHLWSLCVEFAFYLVLPGLAWALRREHRVVIRVAWIAGAALVSLGWAWVSAPVERATDINSQIWPPAYALWFAIGMVAAELEGRVRAPRATWPWWLCALACLWLGSRSWFGPRGLTHPEPAEFARRILVGGVFAACIVVPYALGARSRILESPAFQRLGLWSYAMFLWHVAVLWVAFPLTGISLFSGHFWLIGAVTVALTIPVAAASYYWVEAPAARWLTRLHAQAPSAAAAKKPVSQTSPA